MPTLDVSEAFDPSFMDEFVVLRRVQAVNQYGRMTYTTTEFTVTGVVVPTSPNDLQRIPEAQYTNKAITIYTQWKLQSVAPGYQPDQIMWHGAHFLVRALDDYSGYGRGFLQAICVSIDAVDPAPIMPDPIGNA